MDVITEPGRILKDSTDGDRITVMDHSFRSYLLSRMNKVEF